MGNSLSSKGSVSLNMMEPFNPFSIRVPQALEAAGFASAVLPHRQVLLLPVTVSLRSGAHGRQAALSSTRFFL